MKMQQKKDVTGKDVEKKNREGKWIARQKNKPEEKRELEKKEFRDSEGSFWSSGVLFRGNSDSRSPRHLYFLHWYTQHVKGKSHHTQNDQEFLSLNI